MLERKIQLTDDGELTGLTASILQDQEEMETVARGQDEISSQKEQAMLCLVDKLARTPKAGQRRLWIPIGEDDDRVVLSTIPYIRDSKSAKVLSDRELSRVNTEVEHDFNLLLVSREGFSVIARYRERARNSHEIKRLQDPYCVKHGNHGWLEQYLDKIIAYQDDSNAFKVERTGSGNEFNLGIYCFDESVSTDLIPLGEVEAAFSQVSKVVNTYIEQARKEDKIVLGVAQKMAGIQQEKVKKKRKFGLF